MVFWTVCDDPPNHREMLLASCTKAYLRGCLWCIMTETILETLRTSFPWVALKINIFHTILCYINELIIPKTWKCTNQIKQNSSSFTCGNLTRHCLLHVTIRYLLILCCRVVFVNALNRHACKTGSSSATVSYTSAILNSCRDSAVRCPCSCFKVADAASFLATWPCAMKLLLAAEILQKARNAAGYSERWMHVTMWSLRVLVAVPPLDNVHNLLREGVRPGVHMSHLLADLLDGVLQGVTHAPCVVPGDGNMMTSTSNHPSSICLM